MKLATLHSRSDRSVSGSCRGFVVGTPPTAHYGPPAHWTARGTRLAFPIQYGHRSRHSVGAIAFRIHFAFEQRLLRGPVLVLTAFACQSTALRLHRPAVHVGGRYRGLCFGVRDNFKRSLRTTAVFPSFLLENIITVPNCRPLSYYCSGGAAGLQGNVTHSVARRPAEVHPVAGTGGTRKRDARTIDI